ncbi:uncharacterized protein PG986_014730 [Apiospora aurea]|uniref:LysM domain-containing protein n=1 Tax=Apiospora aurea TaxID=335848 RepID=A0ABR1PTU4_9PEZI
MIKNMSYCVEVNFIKSTPTTTFSRPQETTTSKPTSTSAGTGMVGSCTAFHLVVSGDGCYDIAVSAGVSLDDFYSWNPSVGSDCGSLWGGFNVCTAVL